MGPPSCTTHVSSPALLQGQRRACRGPRRARQWGGQSDSESFGDDGGVDGGGFGGSLHGGDGGFDFRLGADQFLRRHTYYATDGRLAGRCDGTVTGKATAGAWTTGVARARARDRWVDGGWLDGSSGDADPLSRGWADGPCERRQGDGTLASDSCAWARVSEGGGFDGGTWSGATTVVSNKGLPVAVLGLAAPCGFGAHYYCLSYC